MDAGRHIDFESNYRNGFAHGFANKVNDLDRELDLSRGEDLAYLLGYRAGKSALVDMKGIIEDLVEREMCEILGSDRKEDE